MNSDQIAELFNSVFAGKYNTVLCGGATEPLYLPGSEETGIPSRLCFSHDYPRSALHEISHWCIAGAKRRKLPDFGYVYVPPPRATAEQKRFFELELKAQTLEYIFCEAVDIRFSPSADNLMVTMETLTRFMQSIIELSVKWKCKGLAGDAGLFLQALHAFPLLSTARYG